MSSILDALNKLEQEKAQSRREREAPADSSSAAHDLVGRSVLRDRVTVRVSPVTLLVSAASGIALIVAVAIAVALSFAGEDNARSASAAPSSAQAGGDFGEHTLAAGPSPFAPNLSDTFVRLPDPEPTPMPVQIQAPPPASQPSGESVQNATPATESAPDPAPAPPPARTTTARAAAVPPTAPPAAAIEPEAPAAAKTEPIAAPRTEPARSTATDAAATTIEPRVAARSEPATEEAPRSRVARSVDDESLRSTRSLPAADAPATRTRVEDLSSLPILTDADVRRFGLVQMKINMPSPAGPATPQGSAIMTLREESEDGGLVTNTLRFYEGQRIQSTPLRLFKVQRDGVGIEDMRSGDRYRLPF